MMMKSILLCLIVVAWCSLSVNAVIITPFTNCSNCDIYQVDWPTSTTFVIRTGDNRLWRSADEGQYWSLQATNIVAFYSYDSDPLSMLFRLSNKTFYYSRDGAATLTPGTLPATASRFVTHPANVGWFLAPSCSGGKCTVYYTKDFGTTWNSAFTNGVADYTIMWSNQSSTPDTLFFVNANGVFGYSPDYSTFTSLFPQSIGFVMTQHYLYVGIASGSDGATLFSSANRNDPSHTQKDQYIEAEFPFGEVLPERGYTFLDDTTRAEYIAVKRTKNYGTIFTSMWDGAMFATSLPYVPEAGYAYDFDSFQGLNGIYVANRFRNDSALAKETVITFDNGGEWRLVPAPTVDSSNNPINCNLPYCSLQLHGVLSWYYGVTPPFYSSPNAIGLMFAVGTYGTTPSNNPIYQRTVLSRDGGLSWFEIYPGPTIYEFGDHGGILVFSTISTTTDTIYFSLDEGLTTSAWIFTSNPIWVDNIFNEPQGKGQKFVLIGHDNSNKHYIFGIDFSDTVINMCGDSDYENWSPSDAEHGSATCFMGSTTTYLRRKRTSQCYNNRDTDHIVSQDPCSCTFADYECDIDFSPSARNATDGFTCSPDYKGIPSCASGYRLVPDTLCTVSGGLDLNARNCPGYSGVPTNTVGSLTTTGGDNGGGGGGNAGMAVGLTFFFLILIGSAVGLYVLYNRNAEFRNWVTAKIDVIRNRGPEYERVNAGDDDFN